MATPGCKIIGNENLGYGKGSSAPPWGGTRDGGKTEIRK